MIEKSVDGASRGTHFYELAESHDAVAEPSDERFVSLPSTAGPWSAQSQHGGPGAALLTRAIERLDDAAGRTPARVTVELWGPIPVGPLRTAARVVRPGRSVALAESELVDADRDRVVATARAWLLPLADDGPRTPVARLTHGPDDGEVRPRPDGWGAGYLDAIEWRWIEGRLSEAGGGVVWMRTPALVAGEEISPLQRLLACVDSASGAGSVLDVREWAFLNTELTVHVLRPPVGEWLCLEAETTITGGAVGVATSTVHDEQGPVARSAQTLLVVPR